jgi:hypothetical protein
MADLFSKSWDTQDTFVSNDLGGRNCHFSWDTKSGHGCSASPPGSASYLWFPNIGPSIPLSSYLGVPGASVCPPRRAG